MIITGWGEPADRRSETGDLPPGRRGQQLLSTTRWSTTWSASSPPPVVPSSSGMPDVIVWSLGAHRGRFR